MPSLLRRNLTCFYCGSRSAQKQNGQVRQWQCEKCEAVNYLDENGQITDPPALPTPKPVQYAHAIPRAASPTPPPDDTLFCATCLKNQHLLTQALAAYLPPQNDPQYEAYEASYPDYRRSLEGRYPQVCSSCAPKVRARIKAAGYVAKTDHLRRMIERTKEDGGPRHYRGLGWRGALVTVGGWAWWTSVLTQIVWDAAAAVSDDGRLRSSFDDDSIRPLVQSCVQQASRGQRVDKECLVALNPLMPVALLLGFATFWWNPSLREKLRTRYLEGRLVGLGHHFRLQAVVLAARAGLWWASQHPGAARLPSDLFRGFHLIMIGLMLVTVFFSYYLVRMDYTPRVSFHEKVDPLPDIPPPNDAEIRNSFTTTATTPKASFEAQSTAYIKPFPVSNLAPIPPSQFHSEDSEPPTPFSHATTVSDAETRTTIEYGPANAMEWTPTRPEGRHSILKPLQPVRSLNLGQQSQSQPQLAATALAASPSPFYGRLPPAPIAPAHRLRNPPIQPTFQRAPAETQKNFFSKMMGDSSFGTHPPHQNLHDSSVLGDDETLRPSKINLELEPPKWRLKEDPVDTGLEAMFDSVFSIRDEPAEVRAAVGDDGTEDGGGRGGMERADLREAVREALLWGAPLALVAVAVGIGMLREGVW